MAGGRLDPAQAQALFEKGALSKDFMDKVYGDLAADEAADEAQTQDVIATDVATTIASNPQLAALAQKVAEKVPGAQAPLPSSPVVPDPRAAPVVVQAQPTPMAPVPNSPGATVQPVVEETPIVQEPVDTSAYTVLADQQSKDAEIASQNGNPSGVLSQAEQAINTMKQGAIMQAQAAQGTAGHIQSAFADAIGKMESQAKDFSVRNADLLQGYDAELKKQQSAIDQFSEEKVDPNRYWGNMSTFNKVGSLISIALSGAMSGGGTNRAMDLITKAIDRDINTQKDNLAIKKQGMDMRDNFLSKINSRVSSEAQAEQLTRAYMLDQVKSRVEMASVQGDAAKAQGQLLQTLGELQLKSIKAAQEYAVADVNAGNVAAANGEDLPTLDEKADYLALSSKYKGQVIPQIGIARSREAATKGAQKIASYRIVNGKLNELEKLINTYGVETIPSTARVKARSIAKDIFLGIKSAEGLGALDKGAVEFGQGMISDDPLGKRGGFFDDPLGIASRVGNKIAGENLSLTQVKQMKERFQSQFKNNLAVDMLAISPKVRRELLSAGNTSFANENAKSVGKAVAP